MIISLLSRWEHATGPSSGPSAVRKQRLRFNAAAIAIALVLTALSWGSGVHAEESFQEKLTRGILAEESRQDLQSAVAIYSEIIRSADQQRGAIASTLYRLAETQRRLGQTNEADRNYRRLVTEYPESTNLVQLARRQLSSSSPGTTGPASPVAEEELLLQQEIAIADKVLDQTRKMVATGTAGQDSLWKAERDVLQLKRQLAAFRGRHQVIELTSAPAGASPDTAPEDPETREIARLKKLFTNSPDLINASSPSGPPELTRAVSTNYPGVVEYLISIGADVNGMDEKGWTPLAQAASTGNKLIVDLLLKAGASPNPSTPGHTAPLHQAIGFGHKIIAETLIKAGAALDGFGGFQAGERISMVNSTPLGIAIFFRHPAMVDLLVRAGADVNHPLWDPSDKRSRTLTEPRYPITLAANRHDWDKSETLPANRGDWKITELLLDHGANPNPDGVSVLAYASFAPPALWDKLLAKGCKLDLESDAAPTPLNAAVLNSRPEFVAWLLDHGADVNWSDAKGETLVLHAIRRIPNSNEPGDRKGALAVLEELLKRKPILEPRTTSHYPPLAVAVDKGVPEAVDMLLQAGANPDPTLDSFLPLTFAVLKNSQIVGEDRWRIFRALIEAGANPSARTSDSDLLWFVVGRNFDIRYVDLLLKKGANPNQRSDNGLSLLDWLQTFYLNPRITPTPEASRIERAKAIKALLIAAGAREDFPDFDTIKVARASTHFSEVAFRRFGPADRNSFTLVELLAVSYGYLYAPARVDRRDPNDGTASRGDGFQPSPRLMMIRGSNKDTAALRFPAWEKVAIYRYTGAPGQEEKSIIPVNVAALISGANTNDVPLQWGDVVEIPERDHALSDTQAGPEGLPGILDRYLPRNVRFRFNGVDTICALLKQPPQTSDTASGVPGGVRPVYPGSRTLANVLRIPGLVRLSSDLSRIQLRRKTRSESWEATLDCSAPDAGTDIWLQEGDIIEVPEKSK